MGVLLLAMLVLATQTQLGQASEPGNVVQVNSLSGDRAFFEPVIAAVRQWKYTPTLVDGKPVPVIMKVNINFRVS